MRYALMSWLCFWLLAFQLVAYTIDISPDYDYGYRWTSSIFIKLTEEKNEHLGMFISKHLEPILAKNNFVIFETKRDDLRSIQLRIRVNDPQFHQSTAWGFFGGKDNYVRAEHKARCLFLFIAGKEIVLNKTALNIDGSDYLDPEDMQSLEKTIDGKGYLKEFNKLNCGQYF